MWWKVALITLIVLSFFVYFIVDFFDGLLTRALINSIKNKIKQRPEVRFFPLQEIVETIQQQNNEKLPWIGEVIRRLWIHHPKHIRRRCIKASAIEESKDFPGHFGIPKNNSPLLQQFPWEDPTIYEWKITNSKASIWRGIWLAFSMWLLVTGLVFIPLSILEWISPWVSLIVAGFFLSHFLREEMEMREWKKDPNAPHGNALFGFISNQNMYSLVGAGFTTGLYLYLLSSPILPLDIHFDHYSTNKFIWIAYSVQNIIDGIFLDITTYLDISFTNLNAQTFLGRVLMGGLNLLVLSSFVLMIIVAYKSQSEREIKFSGTIKDCYNYIIGNFRLTSHEVTCLGKLELAESPQTLPVVDIIRAFSYDWDEDAEEILPIA